jgi:hypothetical protein
VIVASFMIFAIAAKRRWALTHGLDFIVSQRIYILGDYGPPR